MFRPLLCLLLATMVVAQYNETIARTLARITVCSYCHPSQIEAWNCSECNKTVKMTHVQVIKNSTGDSLGFIGVSDQLDTVALAFRGTLPWDAKNWFSDIDFIKTKYPWCDNGCEVHGGFYAAYKEIEPHVKSLVDNYTATYKKKFLMVTGHSLGAALSTHCVGHLISHGVKVDYFYNFGSPRVGDAKFHEWFGRTYKNFIARVTHWRDVVPHLPDEFWGFHHLSNEVFYSRDMSYYKVCSDTGEDWSCANQFFDPNWEDHMFYCGVDFLSCIECQI